MSAQSTSNQAFIEESILQELARDLVCSIQITVLSPDCLPKKELFVVRHFTTFNELQNLTGWLWDQLLSKARLLERGKTSGRADDNLALSSAQGSVPFSFETRNSYQLFWELNWRQFPCFQQCFWSGFVNLRSFHASPMMPYVSMVENGWPANKGMIGMLQ